MSKLIEVTAELESLLPLLKGSTQGAAVEFALKIMRERQSQPVPWTGAVDTTLRDQFAMAALTGLLSIQGVTVNGDQVVKDAYKFADAMLAVREGKK